MTRDRTSTFSPFRFSAVAQALFVAGLTMNTVSALAQSADADVEVIEVSSRGLISYVSAAGSKIDTPIVETPMSVTVLTEQRFQDLGAETIQDALGYVAGVYNGPFGVDTRGDWAKIRGVAPVQYLDGLKLFFGNYNNTRPNPYSMGQVEVLKGPSSVLYGQGSTGGIINLVSKRPSAEQSAEIWAQVGNYDRMQVAADFTGALNDEASLYYRVNGMLRDSGTQTDYVPDDTLYIAPSLTWVANDDTTVTLLARIQNNNSGTSTQFFPQEGTIFPAPNGQIPSERFVSEPDWDRYDTKQSALTVLVDHDINDAWRLHLATRYMDSSSTYRTMYAWPPVFQEDKKTLVRLAYAADGSAETWNTDLRLHGELETGIITHNIVLGIDYQDATIDTNSGYGYGGPLNLYAPVYGFNPGEIAIQDMPAENSKQLGVYVQDNMKIADRWIVTTAIRHDSVDTQVVGAEKKSQSSTTGRLGLMYVFDGGISPYMSYAESFQPVLGFDAYGMSFKPQEGEQTEVGIKYQPQGTEHLITLSAFQIVDKNRQTSLPASAVNDPAIIDPNGRIQTGEIDIDGVELEAQLAWDEIDVYASYSYLDAVVSESNTVGEKGATLSATPDQMLSTWVTYRPASFWEGFKMGFGFRYIGETSDGSAYVALGGQVLNDPIITDDYTTFDAMLGYEADSYEVTLNVDNLGDKTVITSCLARGDCFYGQRRTVTANFRYKF